jgi:hypothetical protein
MRHSHTVGLHRVSLAVVKVPYILVVEVSNPTFAHYKKMEEISFSWILHTLAGKQCNLPFLPTYVVSETKPIVFVSNRENKIQLSYANQKTVKEVIGKLLGDIQFKARANAIEPVVCYTVTKKERMRMRVKDVQEALESGFKRPVQYIQPARPHAEDYEVYYVLRLEYTKTQYVSSFFKQIDYEKHTFFDSRLFELASDIAKTIMAIIEAQTKKRVMIFEIEYLEDIDYHLWISFIRDLKLAEPVLCLHYLVKTTDDLKGIPIKSPTVTKFTKLTNGQHLLERKNQNRPPIDYTFVKGHIRNRKSDLNIDLSIASPLLPNKEVVSPLSPTPLLRSLSIKTSRIQSSTPQPRKTENMEGRRARALRDEIMKSPILKTKYRLAGLVGILGIEMEKNFNRSLSESQIEEKKKIEARKKRPKSRLVLREEISPRIMSRSPWRRGTKEQD